MPSDNDRNDSAERAPGGPRLRRGRYSALVYTLLIMIGLVLGLGLLSRMRTAENMKSIKNYYKSADENDPKSSR